MVKTLMTMFWVSALTLVFIYSLLSQLVITYPLTIFMVLLSGLTLSLAVALMVSVIKAGK